jgi:hypothetical protein
MLPCDVDALLRAEGSAPFFFPYRKDDYALHLLLLGIGGGQSISMLRQGPFRRLLEKPPVRRALAHAANGVLKPRDLESSGEEREVFLVTLARWGGKRPRDWSSSYYQTSRPGQNLVVQLNFPESHDRAYRRLVEPGANHPFASSAHPVRQTEPFTLAWARLDVDLDAGEVLVEEVQCDWVREARSFRTYAEEWLAEGKPAHLPFAWWHTGTAPKILAYLDRILSRYADSWAECMLSAAIAFAYERLGLRRVYFHTFEGGNLMKRMRSEPPRSLYTELPERFCFRKTTAAPRAFRKDPRVRKCAPFWYALDLV